MYKNTYTTSTASNKTFGSIKTTKDIYSSTCTIESANPLTY